MSDDRVPHQGTEGDAEWIAAAQRAADPRYQLRLYVSGMTMLSERAILATRRMCEEHLPDRYSLEVIDLSQHRHLARQDDIVATPTLVRVLPSPLRRLIGDLSNPERVLAGLGLKSA